MMSGLLRPDTGHIFTLGTDLWILDEDALCVSFKCQSSERNVAFRMLQERNKRSEGG